MSSVDINSIGGIFVAVIALIINLITIIKFTNSLENRLTKLETTISIGVSPNIKKLERMIEIIYTRDNKHRKNDVKEFERN